MKDINQWADTLDYKHQSKFLVSSKKAPSHYARDKELLKLSEYGILWLIILSLL